MGLMYVITQRNSSIFLNMNEYKDVKMTKIERIPKIKYVLRDFILERKEHIQPMKFFITELLTWVCGTKFNKK
jgi:hypothetical protein